MKRKYLLPYTAGIFDGEGSIGIYSHRNKSKRGYTLDLIVSVWNTNQWLPQWLKMNYGGTVVPRTKFSDYAVGGRKPIWKWQLTSKRAQEFLELILPYLYLKRPEAEVAINFQMVKSRRHAGDTSILEEAQEILEKMKLN